jgi:hypothetical protein
MTNSDTIIAWLMHSNWLLLGLWVVLLAAAVGASFPERSAPATNPARNSDEGSSLL